MRKGCVESVMVWWMMPFVALPPRRMPMQHSHALAEVSHSAATLAPIHTRSRAEPTVTVVSRVSGLRMLRVRGLWLRMWGS